MNTSFIGCVHVYIYIALAACGINELLPNTYVGLPLRVTPRFGEVA